MVQSSPFAEATRLPESLRSDHEDGGRLAENIMYFARTLRAAGLPVGPGKALRALEAVQALGLRSRQDFYWALHCVFVNRRDQREVFDQAFHVFWRNPQFLDRMRNLFLPDISPEALKQSPDAKEINRRVAEALAPQQAAGGRGQEKAEERIEIDAVMSWSDKEVLREQDFEKMSTAEVEVAKRAIANMRLPIMALPTRRFRPSERGTRTDLRGTLRAAMRGGSDTIPLKRKEPKRRHPPLVVLCDISGSMSRYSRLFLHFLHAITNDRDRVHSFLFGTRLTNITRHLRHKDVDLALDKVGGAVTDWSGGTRITPCLAAFNKVWSRRVLGQGAVVLLITDGLERDGAETLSTEMERLHKSCRRLIWLNPLLRYEGYQPKSRGAKAILPHVDDFRPIHNLDSLAELTAVLSRAPQRRQEGVSDWLAHADLERTEA